MIKDLVYKYINYLINLLKLVNFKYFNFPGNYIGKYL